MKSSPTPRMLWIESLESRCLLAGGLLNASPATMPPTTLADPGDHHPAEPPHHVSFSTHRAANPGENRLDQTAGDAHSGQQPHRPHDRHHNAAHQRRGSAPTAMPGSSMPGVPMRRPPMQAAPTPTEADRDRSSATMSRSSNGSSGLSPGTNSSDSDLSPDASDSVTSDLITNPARDDLSAGVLTASPPVQTNSQQTIHPSVPLSMTAQPNSTATRDVVGSTADNAGLGDEASNIQSLPDTDDATGSHASREAHETNPLIDDFSLRPRAPLPAPAVEPLTEWELDEDTLDRLKAVAESRAERSEQGANVAWDAIVATWFDGPGGLIELTTERNVLMNADALDQIVAVELDAGLGLHRSLDLLAATEPAPSEDELRVAILNAIAQAERPAVAPPRDQAAARTSALTYPAIVLIAGSLVAAWRRQRAPKRSIKSQANKSSAPS